ncbi:MAG: nicotinate (nicotinamide) nucleotide adenylyltransferase [Alcaligenaceae bacterium]|nr:nicotinate (nicotinamide) nucleotide adenylyltransferase [Alcaligenaceae bacterium]
MKKHKSTKQRALFGGSFDPVHLGHLQVARFSYEQLGFDTIEFLPAAHPSQKLGQTTAIKHRLEMLRLATADMSFATINTIEIDKGGVTYTIDTLKTLHTQDPDSHFFFIMGDDQLINFCTWKQWQEILEYAHLVIFDRQSNHTPSPPELSEYLQKTQQTMTRVNMPLNHLSSSEIRKHIIENKNIAQVKNALTPAVFEYIRTHQLYTP